MAGAEAGARLVVEEEARIRALAVEMDLDMARAEVREAERAGLPSSCSISEHFQFALLLPPVILRPMALDPVAM